jgi:folate-binding protein YgfZ
MTPGYQALHHSAAWLDLSPRGRIVARGRDRARLLHALTSNDIKKMAPGDGSYAFLLSPQGRIQADLCVFCFPGHFLLDTEPELREKVHQHIKRYIIADQVELEDVTAQTACIAVEGPTAATILDIPPADYAHAPWDGCTVARVTVTGQPGARIFCSLEKKDALIAKLESAGASPATPDDARIVRIENGRPRYGEDITDTSLPQETQQMHGVSFTKGCYLGQEIVERIRARGHVNRRLVRLELETGQPPEGAQITSTIVSPATGKTIALAYVREGQSH